MSTRVTISLPRELAAQLKDAAGNRSVSSFVADLIRENLQDEDIARLWRAYLDDVGVGSTDIATADRILDDLLNRVQAGAA